jgi:nucleotide-binding universal stress UspA family protein
MIDSSGTALLAYDGSENAAAAIRQAGSLLACRRAVAVRVWDSLGTLPLGTDIKGLTGSMREAAKELDEEDARDANQFAEEGAQLAREAGFEAESRALRGRPKAWPTLLEAADRIDAAVIVTGSRGLGGVASALLGSVSSGLLHHSHRPLLVVPPVEGDEPRGPMIVGYDGSDGSRLALEAAGRLLLPREAIVETVWTPYTPVAAGGVAGAPTAVITRAAEEIDREIATGARRTAEEGVRLGAARGLEVRAQPVEASGSVWRMLIHSAREHRAAVLVVGSRGRSAAGAAVLGSVSTGLIHHTPVAVMVVPHGR